ncbi:recombinase family protein [Eubacteriales bacterium OttesenSCG-928-N13]|nr:recombinase family protein [Eubacteriales bacterium OttesenSCG-928-N13]
MRHAPYGYRIENGRAVIEETEAEQIKKLFQAYLSGASLTNAGIAAGIDARHTGIGRMLRNKRYLGDGFYPSLIDPETFAAAEVERLRRAELLGRADKVKTIDKPAVPVAFILTEAKQTLDDPFQQAEYIYSLIETEDKENGCQ